MSKYQWIFIELGLCIDIVEIWFWIANWQILSIFDRVICLQDIHTFCLGVITSINLSGFSSNLLYALIMWRSGLGLLMGLFLQFLTESSTHDTIREWYNHFTLYCFFFWLKLLLFVNSLDSCVIEKNIYYSSCMLTVFKNSSICSFLLENSVHVMSYWYVIPYWLIKSSDIHWACEMKH